MENKSINNRRKFLKDCGILGIGICSGSLFMSSCTKNVLSPFRTKYAIIEDKCTGCGDCVESCYYKAILLPQKTQYFINQDLCIECGTCEPQCKDKAIFISTPTYNILEDKCIGCGKCIEKCINEGNCISYSKETYSIRNKCKPTNCHHQCQLACEFGAITIKDKCIIDLSKCTKCGKCVGKCPFEAINPAKVTKNEELCNHCGLCLAECNEFNAISKLYPLDYAKPTINQDICTSCGDCKVFCEKYDAIKYNNHVAKIDSTLCVDCGKCVESCEKYEAIKLVED